MRTTIALPEDLFRQAQVLAGDRSFSHFVREAVRFYVERLREEKLAKEMEEGYSTEARSPSLDADWSNVDLDGWS